MLSSLFFACDVFEYLLQKKKKGVNRSAVDVLQAGGVCEEQLAFKKKHNFPTSNFATLGLQRNIRGSRKVSHFIDIFKI